MFDAPILELIIAIALIALVVEVGLILSILLQTAFEHRRMNDANMKDKIEYRKNIAQDAIVKDHLEKEHLACVIKDVLDKVENK